MPRNAKSLPAALQTARAGFIVASLICPDARIATVATAEAVDISQFRLVDVPLAVDHAINAAAAAKKAIVADAAGRVDILLMPDREAGNMLAKQLTFMAGATARAGVRHQPVRVTNGG